MSYRRRTPQPNIGPGPYYEYPGQDRYQADLVAKTQGRIQTPDNLVLAGQSQSESYAYGVSRTKGQKRAISALGGKAVD
jgi:hypothetical protein